MKVTIEKTADGTPTLYLEDLDEHYHSVKGALAESRHVYIDLGWRAAAEMSNGMLRVFEVGFGTGLNAALTARAALEAKKHTVYYSVERYPLSPELADRLIAYQGKNYADEFKLVNQAEWNREVRINDFFVICKIEDDLLTMELPGSIDAVYFDAFAPEKQPEMWEKAIFSKLYTAMSPDAVLTTYCAKGIVRRRLQDCGFCTERLPGPPGGKREVLRANKPAHDVG